MTMTEDSIYLTTALAGDTAGLSMLPPEEDGSKEPLRGGWKKHQQIRADEPTIRAWYANGRTGVGAVMGCISGNIELFEFDDGATYVQFKQAARAAGLGGLVSRIEGGYSERTPGGGIHWYYRCSRIERSKKLARRLRRPEEQRNPDDRIKVLIETKGEGGYSIMAPSGGRVHETGGSYERMHGSLDSIVTITPLERQDLWTLARAFDQMPRKEPRGEPAPTTNQVGGRPGDDFIARADWAGILQPHGWRAIFTQHEVTYWRRPGKDRGISASTNWNGSDLLWVWSTSTVFDSERGYNKFNAYALLNHDGDYGAAAQELKREGYGEQPHVIIGGGTFEPPPPEIDPETGEIKERVRRFEIIDAPDFIGRPPMRWLVPGLLPEQTFVCIVGQPGSYKSFIALDLLACIATGTPFHGYPTRQGSCLYIAGEGAGGFAKRLRAWEIDREMTLPRALKILPGVVPLTDHAAVRDLILDIKSFGEPFSAIVVDTLSRAMPGADENASKDMTAAVAAAEMLQHELGCVVIVIHHGTKADGTIRGHSSLPGALDTIIRVAADKEGIVTVSSEKQKDGEEFKPFYLQRIVIDVSDGAVSLSSVGVEAKPTSVALKRLSTDEEEARRGERKVKSLTNRQRAVLVRLITFGGIKPTNKAWLEAARLDEPEMSRQTFSNVKAALIARALVLVENEGDGEEIYAAAPHARAAVQEANE